jgi:hypothetical protein
VVTDLSSSYRLRTAAKDELAAQARQARAARRCDTEPGPDHRLIRALQHLAQRVGAARQPVLSPASGEYNQIARKRIHLMAGAREIAMESRRHCRAHDTTRQPNPARELRSGQCDRAA